MKMVLNVLDRWKPNIPSAKSKCVLLKNMFDPKEETEPNWDTELRDDVKQECMGKYGQVRDIYVLRDSDVCLFCLLGCIALNTRVGGRYLHQV